MYIHVHCNIIYTDKILKQPKCPSLDEWIKKLWYTQTYTYKRVLLSHKKGILAIYDNMDGSRGYYASEMSVSERHIPYDLTYEV